VRHAGLKRVFLIFSFYFIAFRFAFYLKVIKIIYYLVAHESREVDGLGGVILGEGLDLSLGPLSPLARKETKRTTARALVCKEGG
jgi:hypothetical protein